MWKSTHFNFPEIVMLIGILSSLSLPHSPFSLIHSLSHYSCVLLVQTWIEFSFNISLWALSMQTNVHTQKKTWLLADCYIFHVMEKLIYSFWNLASSFYLHNQACIHLFHHLTWNVFVRRLLHIVHLWAR